MPEAARSGILERLRAVRPEAFSGPRDTTVIEAKRWSPAERVARLRQMMESVRTEFLDATRQSWPAVVRSFLAREGARNLLYAPATNAGRVLEAASNAGDPPLLVPYDRPVEQWKAELFADIDAALTETRGAVAETGSLIVWPSPAEPRLMSLVPPIHVALLETDRIRDTFWQVMRDESWASGMPANALLISGPSKTADIEQTLAYGVHGPKRLVVVLISCD